MKKVILITLASFLSVMFLPASALLNRGSSTVTITMDMPVTKNSWSWVSESATAYGPGLFQEMVLPPNSFHGVMTSCPLCGQPYQQLNADPLGIVLFSSTNPSVTYSLPNSPIPPYNAPFVLHTFLSFKDGGEDGTKHTCDMFFYIYYNMQMNASFAPNPPSGGFGYIVGSNSCTIPNFNPHLLKINLDQVTGDTTVNVGGPYNIDS